MCGMTIDQSLFMTLAIQEAQKDDAQPDGSADKSELPIQQSSASAPSYRTAGQDAEGMLNSNSIRLLPRRRENDRPMEPRLCPGRSTSARKRHCRDAEDNMMQSDAELGAMEEQMTTEVNKGFHNDRSTNAISRQRKILMGPDFESGHPKWSSSELSHLRTIVSSGEHIPTTVKSWAEQTGSKRTPDAVVARLKLIAAEAAVPWTDEEDAALMIACEGLDKKRPMTEAFKSATETKRTDKDIIQRIEYLGLNLGHGPNPECENHSSFQCS